MDEFQETKSGDEQVKDEKLSSLEKEAIEKMMSNLPDELEDEQRNKVKDLLIRHRSIISTGEHDIGRTQFVEHRNRYRRTSTNSSATSPTPISALRLD